MDDLSTGEYCLSVSHSLLHCEALMRKYHVETKRKNSGFPPPRLSGLSVFLRGSGAAVPFLGPRARGCPSRAGLPVSTVPHFNLSTTAAPARVPGSPPRHPAPSARVGFESSLTARTRIRTRVHKVTGASAYHCAKNGYPLTSTISHTIQTTYFERFESSEA